MFDILWNLILGISGGVISSVIVSRIFLIQSDFQNQIDSFKLLIRKLGYISGILTGIRTIQEFSYDSEIEMQKEMDQKGYKTEDEYYRAHSERNWISKDRIITELLNECKKMNQRMREELMSLVIREKELSDLRNQVQKYSDKVSSTKEMSFSTLNELDKEQKEIVEAYDAYVKKSSQKLFKLVLKDKYMITMYICVGGLIVLTILSYIFKW